MATAYKLDDAPTGIVEITPQTALALFTDKEKYSEFYSRIKAETDKFVPDLTTKKGRDAIATEARKVVTAKTTLEKAGKGLVEEWRAKTNLVTSARIEMVNELDALAKEVRRPLTEWEEAEKARITECQVAIDAFKRARVVDPDDTAADVRERGSDVFNQIIDPDRFGDMFEEAQAAKTDAVETLKRALVRLTQEEADRAELARLRAESEAREARETEEREAREKAEREAEQARITEERRVAAERADLDRIERAKAEAAASAQREAEQRARDEQAERDRKHAAELQAERDKAAEVERVRQAEIDRANAAEAARVAEQAKREANLKHRTAVKTAAKKAIMRFGVSDEIATAIVIGIMAGDVPAVTLSF